MEGGRESVECENKRDDSMPTYLSSGKGASLFARCCKFPNHISNISTQWRDERCKEGGERGVRSVEGEGEGEGGGGARVKWVLTS